MQWTSDTRGFSHSLDDNGTELARMHLADRPDRKNRFRVRVLVSFLYFGKRAQKRLERSRKEWKATTRKFPTEPEARKYIETKKAEIMRFVVQRENH